VRLNSVKAVQPQGQRTRARHLDLPNDDCSIDNHRVSAKVDMPGPLVLVPIVVTAGLATIAVGVGSGMGPYLIHVSQQKELSDDDYENMLFKTSRETCPKN
jgi:hypothetical protein